MPGKVEKPVIQGGGGGAFPYMGYIGTRLGIGHGFEVLGPYIEYLFLPFCYGFPGVVL